MMKNGERAGRFLCSRNAHEDLSNDNRGGPCSLHARNGIHLVIPLS